MVGLVAQFDWRLAEGVFFLVFMLIAMGSILLSHGAVSRAAFGVDSATEEFTEKAFGVGVLNVKKTEDRNRGICKVRCEDWSGRYRRYRAGRDEPRPARYNLVNDVIDRCFFHGPLARLRVTMRQS